MENKGISGQSLSLPDKSTLLKARVSIGVTRLFKNYLFALEELVDAHDEAMNKLKDALPEDQKKFVDLADYLSDNKVEAIRKKVLGLGNDLIRDTHDTIDSLRI